MKKKILLLDMDGVVIKSGEVFSIRISKKLNIPIDAVLPFFKNEFQLCLVGKADLAEVLKKYAPLWGWKGTVSELMTFWFEGEKEVNIELVNEVSQLRKAGYKAYIATNNEKYRCEFLWNSVDLRNNFDGLFSSAEIGFKKPSHEFYLKVLDLLNAKSSDVMFFDDDEENVKSAKEIGMNARYYSGISDFKVV